MDKDTIIELIEKRMMGLDALAKDDIIDVGISASARYAYNQFERLLKDIKEV